MDKDMGEVLSKIDKWCSLHARCKDCVLYDKAWEKDAQYECLMVPPSKLKKNIYKIYERLGIDYEE